MNFVKAWVPSHVTGFFAAKPQKDPKISGSIGCGLCLSLGATTTIGSMDDPGLDSANNLPIVTSKEPNPSIEILLNGKFSEAPVSRYVAKSMTNLSVCLKTELDMPQGSGFGASGAGALGCAYVLNSWLGLGLTSNQVARVAHSAEVINRTGLGDVIAQNIGGMVVRFYPGAPGIGKIDRIPVSPLQVNYVVRGPISTKQVLSDDKIMKAINKFGKICLKELLRKPTLNEFMRLSRFFTLESGLASDWVRDAIEAVVANGGMASMIMLGDAVFAFGGAKVLREFGSVGTTTISQRGANLD